MPQPPSGVPVVSAADVASALRSLGLGGRTLMVHSSLRAFGHVDGGAAAVLSSLQEVASPGGTLVLPSFAWCADEDAGGENLPPEGTPLAAPPPHRPFDPAETPAATGRISDTFWRQPGVVRGEHPTHALAARGPRAGWILRDHPPGRCCAWDGPYGRMTEDGAWVVLLGVGVSSLTYLHALEDRAGVPYLRRAVGYLRRPSPAGAGEPGRVWALPQTHYPSGDRDFYQTGSRVAAWIAGWPEDERRSARVGGAEVTALATAALSRRVGEAIARDPLFLLCTRPGCAFCGPWRAGAKAAGTADRG